MQLLLNDEMRLRFHKKAKTNIWGDCPKMVAWTVCRFEGGGGGLSKKERSGVFLRGVDTPMHTMTKKRRLMGKMFLIYERLQE